MKQKNLKRKLTLNKETVADMQALKAGGPPYDPYATFPYTCVWLTNELSYCLTGCQDCSIEVCTSEPYTHPVLCY